MKLVRTDTLKVDAAGIVACALMGGAVYLFGLGPLINAQTTRESLDFEVLSLSEQVEVQTAATQAYGEALELIESRLGVEPVELRDAEGLSSLLAAISLSTQTHHLVVDALTPRIVEHDEAFDRIPIELRGQGSYPDVARFIHELRVSDPTIAVRMLDLRAGSGEQPAVFHLELVWFVQPVTPRG